MFSRDYGHTGPTRPNTARPATLGANFTRKEMTQLEEMRRNYYTHAEYLERVIDERRLEFARWLRENGKLSEDDDLGA